jgi:hypothetical protein
VDRETTEQKWTVSCRDEFLYDRNRAHFLTAEEMTFYKNSKLDL